MKFLFVLSISVVALYSMEHEPDWLSKLNNNFEKLSAQMNTLSTKFEDASSKLENFENRMTGLETEVTNIAVLLSTTVLAQKKTQEDLDATTKELATFKSNENARLGEFDKAVKTHTHDIDFPYYLALATSEVVYTTKQPNNN